MKALQLPMSLSNLNHELRTPLTTILGIASFLENEAFNAEQKLYVKNLQTSAHSLLTLANKLSSLAKEIDLQKPCQNNVAFSTCNAKVLLVEDTPFIQVVHKKMLENLGLSVEIAKSGEEALDKLSLNIYTLIFMDIGLPGISGIEAAIEIRHLNCKKKYTPIIALTGYVEPETQQACLDAGINIVVNKPITQDNLCILISHFSSKKNCNL